MNEIINICVKLSILSIWMMSPVLVGGLLRMIHQSERRYLLALLGALLIIWSNTFGAFTIHDPIESSLALNFPSAYDSVRGLMYWLGDVVFWVGIETAVVSLFVLLGIIAVDKIGWFHRKVDQGRCGVLLLSVGFLMLLLATPSVDMIITTCGFDLAVSGSDKGFCNVDVVRIRAARVFGITCGVMGLFTFVVGLFIQLKRRRNMLRT